MRHPFLAMFLSWLGLSCTGGGLAWRSQGALPARFSPSTLLDMADGGLLAAGYVSEGDGRIESWTAMTVRVDEQGVVSGMSHGKGWIAAAGARGERAVAVRGEYHSEDQSRSFHLMESKDGGRSWDIEERFDAVSVERVALAPDGGMWVLGAQTLLWRGAGTSQWVAVDLPGALRGIHQPICFDTQGRVLIGGPGLYRSADQGEHWEKLAEAEIVGCDGRWVVSREKPGFRVGEIVATGIDWSFREEAAVLPTGIVGAGEQWAVRSEPLGRAAGGAIWLFLGQRNNPERVLERLSGGSDSARLGLGANLWWMRQDRVLKRASLLQHQ